MNVYDHPEWLALVRSIRETPECDTPRLVAADWLDERGEAARAEFIRVQCELALGNMRPGVDAHARARGLVGAGYAADGPEVTGWRRPGDLRAREWELAFRAADRGRRLVPGVPDDWALKFDRSTYRFERPTACVGRGFVARVSCPGNEWLAHAAAVLAAHPVRRVRLTTTPDFPYLRWSWGVASALVAGREVEVAAHDNPMVPLLEARWPGIAFELTPVEVTVELTGFATDADLAELHDG